MLTETRYVLINIEFFIPTPSTHHNQCHERTNERTKDGTTECECLAAVKTNEISSLAVLGGDPRRLFFLPFIFIIMQGQTIPGSPFNSDFKQVQQRQQQQQQQWKYYTSSLSTFFGQFQKIAIFITPPLKLKELSFVWIYLKISYPDRVR